MARESETTAGSALIRAAMAEHRTLISLGAHDAISAALVEQHGSDVVYVGSYTTEGAAHMHPDVGLMSKSERRSIVANIVRAVDVPVFADIEEGWGPPLAVACAIEEFEAAGAAMVHIDDQLNPGVCPYLPGLPPVELVDTGEMCRKVEAAANARKEMLIVARCDISGHVRNGEYTQEQREELVRRSNEYLAAGADACLVGTYSEYDIRFFADEVKGPVIGLIEDALPHSVSTFREAGYLMVMGPTLALFAAIKGMRDALEAFQKTWDWKATEPYRVTADEYYELLQWDDYLSLVAPATATGAPR